MLPAWLCLLSLAVSNRQSHSPPARKGLVSPLRVRGAHMDCRQAAQPCPRAEIIYRLGVIFIAIIILHIHLYSSIQVEFGHIDDNKQVCTPNK